MKKIILYTIIGVVIIASTQCYMRKPVLFSPFQRNAIDSVIMKQAGSVSHKKLSPAQIDKLIPQINAAEYTGLYKALYEFEIRIYGKQDTAYRQITSFGSMFKLKKERGDYTFQVKDTSLFRELWLNH